MRHILLLALALAGCTSKLEVSTRAGQPAPASSAMTITSRRPVVARAGDTVELAGTGFKPTMKLAMVSGGNLGLTDTKDLKVNVESESRASFQVPPDVGSGVFQLAASQDGQAQTISLVFATEATTDQPIFTGEAAEICAGRKFYDANGDMKTGAKPCAAEDQKAKSVVECTKDGETDCIATVAFTAAATEGLATKIVEGSTVAGVEGAAKGIFKDCSEGDIDCVVREPLAAVNPSLLSPANIRSGVTIAGVSGAVVPSPPLCAADGAASCVVDGTAYKAAALANATPGNIKAGATVAGVAGSVAPSPASCTADGAVGCVTTSGFKAADTSSLAASDLKSGKTVAGLAGSLSTCAADGQTDCVAAPTFPAVDKAVKLVAGNIKSGVTIAGIAGSVTPAPADCAADGDTACVATTSYRAAATSGLAAKVVTGQTVAGQAGSVQVPLASQVVSGVGFGVSGTGTVVVPSASDVRLAVTYGAGSGLTGTLDPGAGVPGNCSADGETGCVAVTSFPAVDKAVKLVAGNIKSGVTIAGVAGSVTPSPANCSSDGETSCVTVASFKAADMSVAVAGNIKSGATIAGVAGNVTPSPGACSADGGFACVVDGSTYKAAKLSNFVAGDVKSGVTVAGVAGSLGDCAADAATGCVAVTAFKAADMTNVIAGNIKSSVTIAGVAGSVTPSPANCSADGSTGCVAVSTYPAAKLANFVAGDVKSGITVAGVAGSLGNCAADGATACVAVSAFKAADLSTFAATDVKSGKTIAGVSGSLGDCSADGATGCVAVSGFKAADMTAAVAGNIKSGATIAGVAGSVTPSPANCGADGATGCVAVTAYPAAKLANFAASDVKSGVTVAGVAGSLGNCGTDGATSCVAVAAYPAAKLANFVAGDVKSGVTVAGVAGSLGDCAADAATGCVAVTAFKAADMSVAVAGNIKSGATIAGVSGNVTPSPANCSADGSTGCVTTSTYKSADTSAFAAGDVKSGKTIAGVAGSLGNCGTDGATSCVAVAAYPAAKLANFAASDVKSGVTVAGVAGSLADCSADGSTGCVAVSGFKAADMSVAVAGNIKSGATIAGVAGSVTPAPANCSSDGATGCVAVTAYKAADMANVTAANIKSGVTIAGVAGDFPSATNKLTGASGTTDLVSLAASTAAGSYEWWGPDGARYTGSITDAGTVTPTTSNQTFNTSVYRQFVVSGDANLVAGKIKSGVSLFGVTGDYPSATYPLTGADTTADLDFATFDAKIKSSASFEWFDPYGTRYTNTGDTDITAANISNGVTIFGTTGTLAGGSNCTGDGQTSCVTTSRYKSMDTDSSVISAWDIRSGKTAGGIAGSLVFYKNMANTTLFDRTSGTGGVSGLDIYDTIDDYNNNGAFPTQNNTGWAQATGANWLRDSASDNGAGGGTASDGICNGTEDCVYKDQVTAIYWAKADATTRTWETAITYCDGLTYGGYSDWRLPTQKELMQAYTDGIWSQKASTKLNIAANYHWSSSTVSSSTTTAWIVAPYYGYTNNSNKTTSYNVLCVSP